MRPHLPQEIHNSLLFSCGLLDIHPLLHHLAYNIRCVTLLQAKAVWGVTTALIKQRPEVSALALQSGCCFGGTGVEMQGHCSLTYF